MTEDQYYNYGERQEPDGLNDVFGLMAKNDPPKNDPTVPLDPKAVDGSVEMIDPPETAMGFTPDTAEISAMRLLDAADRARKRH